MQSTLKDADPHDIFAIEPSFAATRPDNAAAPAQQAGKVAGQREPWFGPSLAPSSLAPSSLAPSSLAPSSAPPIASAAAVASVPPVTPISAAPVPPAMPEYSASHDGRLDDIRLERAPRPTNKWAIRAFWFVFAIAGAMGTAAWQHYGHRVKQVVAEYVPQIEALTSLLPGKTAAASDQATPPAAQAAADQPAEAAPAAAPQDVATAAPAPAAAPAAAAAPVAPATPAAPAAGAPDQTQLLQSMAHDLASMGQQIEQLKASIDQLKAGQDQLTQRVARTTETRAVEPRPVPPRPRAAITPAVPHTAVAPPPVRRPTQAYIPPPPPASAAPLPAPAPVAPQSAVTPRPVQSQQQSSVVDADDGGPVVRPPMPLR
ncbi:hypothetical protein [Bradyrhizobium sp. USDA 4451]